MDGQYVFCRHYGHADLTGGQPAGRLRDSKTPIQDLGANRCGNFFGVSGAPDHLVHPAGPYRLQTKIVGLAVGPDTDVPDLSHPVLYLVADGIL